MNGTVRLAAAGIFGLAFSLAGCSGSNPPQGPAAGAVATGGSAADPQSERMASEAASDLGFLRFAFTEERYGKAPERTPKSLDEAALSINVQQGTRPGDYTLTVLGQAQVPFHKDPKSADRPNTLVSIPSRPITITVTEPPKK